MGWTAGNHLQGRLEQGQRVDEVRAISGQLEGDDAADGVADDMSLTHPKMVKKRGGVRGLIRNTDCWPHEPLHCPLKGMHEPRTTKQRHGKTARRVRQRPHVALRTSTPAISPPAVSNELIGRRQSRLS